MGALAADAKKRLVKDPHAVARFDRILAEGLGNSWRLAGNLRFDTQLAAQSLRFFEADYIPKPDPNIPIEVSGVHFVADLEDVSPVDTSTLTALGGLFAAAVPRPGRASGSSRSTRPLLPPGSALAPPTR